MSIQKLKITHVRNLKSIILEPSASINLFSGHNGSGKTSLLEAIYFLGLTRSFRTNKMLSFISESHQNCSVYGKIVHNSNIMDLGVSRTINNKQKIKIEGVTRQSVAELAHYLPIQLIHPDSFTCLQAAPSIRRKILDWGVFYHHPQFGVIWKMMYLSLKHRNALLRSKRYTQIELDTWTKTFLESATQIHILRMQYIAQLIPEFKHIIYSETKLQSIDITYYPGWNDITDLRHVLASNQSKDMALGYTTAGPQRADLKITYQGRLASDILSRGQQKILVCALKVAQGKLFEKTHKQRCVFLVDDLPAELDPEHCEQFINMINPLFSQFWLTAINTEQLQPFFSKKTIKMFHVEHGAINN